MALLWSYEQIESVVNSFYKTNKDLSILLDKMYLDDDNNIVIPSNNNKIHINQLTLDVTIEPVDPFNPLLHEVRDVNNIHF